jgi:hypothetical protein
MEEAGGWSDGCSGDWRKCVPISGVYIHMERESVCVRERESERERERRVLR